MEMMLEERRVFAGNTLNSPKFGALFMDLNGELTSRSKNKYNRSVTRGQEGLSKIQTSASFWLRRTRGTYALMCSIAGRAKDIVFPLPVWAIATTSLPDSATGQDWHWMGDGDLKPACLMEVRM